MTHCASADCQWMHRRTQTDDLPILAGIQLNRQPNVWVEIKISKFICFCCTELAEYYLCSWCFSSSSDFQWSSECLEAHPNSMFSFQEFVPSFRLELASTCLNTIQPSSGLGLGGLCLACFKGAFLLHPFTNYECRPQTT